MKSLIVDLRITISGDCDGEEEDDDKERLLPLLLVLFCLVTTLLFTILIGDAVCFGITQGCCYLKSKDRRARRCPWAGSCSYVIDCYVKEKMYFNT